MTTAMPAVVTVLMAPLTNSPFVFSESHWSDQTSVEGFD